MEEQVSIIISILTALLTGGFIILYLENQHVGANTIERYHFLMKPFMHRLSNYFKFLSSASTYFHINGEVSKDEAEYVFAFKGLTDKLSRYAHPCIMSGQDYPVTEFIGSQLESICGNINNVWYYWDNKRNYMTDFCYYDTVKAEQCGKVGKEYLNEVFPSKYTTEPFSIDLISNVSGAFYTEVYQPIQNMPYEYEYWCKQERCFQNLTFVIIGLCLMVLLIILLVRYFITLWILSLLTTICIALFGYNIYQFTEIEKLSRKLFR